MALLLPVLLLACRPDSPPAPAARALPSGTLVAVIGPYESHPAWRAVRGGAMRYDAQYPNIACFAVAPRENDPQELNEVATQVLARRPLAACLYVEDPEIAHPAAERLTRQGVLLVTIGRPLPGVTCYGHVTAGWPEAAERLARSLPRLLPPVKDPRGRLRTERSYILIHENGRNDTATECYRRFMAVVPGSPALNCLESANAAQAAASPSRLIDGILDRFKSAELVVTLTPRPWLTLEPRYRLPSGHHFATLGAAPRLWPRLQSEEALALVGPLDGELGYAAVELAVQGLMLIPDNPRRLVIPCEFVTPATLDDFARRYARAAGLKLEDFLPYTAVAPASRPRP